MEIGESQAFLGNLIDVRSADLAAEAAHIRETEVIGDGDEEIGPFSHGGCSLSREVYKYSCTIEDRLTP